jgi:hypothetical protein
MVSRVFGSSLRAVATNQTSFVQIHQGTVFEQILPPVTSTRQGKFPILCAREIGGQRIRPINGRSRIRRIEFLAGSRGGNIAQAPPRPKKPHRVVDSATSATNMFRRGFSSCRSCGVTLNERPSQVNAYKDNNQPAYQVFFSR